MRKIERDTTMKHTTKIIIWLALMTATSLSCLVNTYAISYQQRDTLNQIMDLRMDLEESRSDLSISVSNEQKGKKEVVSLGEFKITHYCPCQKCCGKTDGITYTGTVATAGRTIGVDPKVIPLGSTVIIDGHEYVAEDIGGGIKGDHIDLFVNSHEEALQLGVYVAEVLLVL